MAGMYSLENVKEVLNQALQCRNPEVFLRVLVGYVRDNRFWENATDEVIDYVETSITQLHHAVRNNVLTRKMRE